MAVEVFSYLSQTPDVTFILDEIGRERLIDELYRLDPSNLDAQREEWIWDKSGLYFHIREDLRTAKSCFNFPSDPEAIEGITNMQACYYKDLLKYISSMPPTEKAMQPLFENLLVVGTSFRWVDSQEAVEKLKEYFSRINNEAVKPWINTGKIPRFELWNSDDYSNGHRIFTFLDRDEAKLEKERFERRIHKQTYEIRDTSYTPKLT